MIRLRQSLVFLLVVVLFEVAWPARSVAQRIIYSNTRDDQAKAAVAAAGDVASDSLFATLSKNVEEAGKQQLETIMKWQEVKLRANLNAFSTWGDITAQLDAVDDAIKPALDDSSEQSAAVAAARMKELEERAKALKAEIAAFQEANKDQPDRFGEALSHLGEVKQVVDFASQLPVNPAKIQALNEVIASVEQVQKLYTSLRGIFTAAKDVKTPIAEMGPRAQQTQLDLIRVEEEHLKRVGLIRARQALEVGNIKLLVDIARGHVGKVGEPASRRIEESLVSFNAPASRDKLEFAILALYAAAAVVAQNETSAQFADLRRGLEERRASIERTGVAAGASEQRVREATRRLQAYWQSGLKATDVAALLYHLSTAISLPIIAGK
jgi:hypothetical protein